MHQIALTLLASWLLLSLCACSGVRRTAAGGGTSNGTLSITLRSTPPSPTANLSILAFRATITGVSLHPAAGGAVSVGLVSGSPDSYVAEFTRLQSDTALLTSGVSVPAGTYNSLVVSFSDVSLVYCIEPSSGVSGCSLGSLTQVAGSAGIASIGFGAFPLTVTNGQRLGLAIDVSIPKAITINGQTITAVNLAAANVFTSTALQEAPDTGDLSSGQLSHIDDLYGVVSNVATATQSFTLQTAYRGAISVAAGLSTTYDPVCPAQGFSCVTDGALAAVDAILNSDGTLTLRNYSPVPFTPASQDTVEGVVTSQPNVTNQVFDVTVTDATFALANSLLSGSVRPGDPVTVGLVAPKPFFIVSEGLTIPTNRFDGSTDVNAIQPGQTVVFSISGFETASGDSAFSTATTSSVALRFSRVTGTVLTATTSSQFTAANFPPYFGFSTNPVVQITSGGRGNTTDFDGTSRSNLLTGDTVSISALYFGPTPSPSGNAGSFSFSAATVRKH